MLQQCPAGCGLYMAKPLASSSDWWRPEGRDVQREIPVPSLPYGFKLFPPGNFPYGNSREIPGIREFPILREFREFLAHGKFPFS